MTVLDAILALFLQPAFGIPLLLLLVCLTIWWAWESRLLPPKPVPYAIRPYWMLDSVRLLHEALAGEQLGSTIQVVYTWLSREFVRRYGVPVSRFVGPRGYFLRERIPFRPDYVRAVKLLQSAFFDALYAEAMSDESWFATWRRPRARARALRKFAGALPHLEKVGALLSPPTPGAVN